MNLNLLLIDDNAFDRILFKKRIAKSNYDIHIEEAETANQGLEKINSGKNYDCIFLDYMLPDDNGINLLKKIHDPETDLTPCPVVIFTGRNDENIAIEAIKHGAQDYLLKEQMSQEAIHISIAKAKQVFELKKNSNETKALLQHSQKLDAIGQLTGGIAHDFNNLLTINFGNIRLLMNLLREDKPDRDLCIQKLQIIEKATKRGANLIKRLMIFSRQRSLEPVTIDVNTLVVELEELLQRSLGEFVEIEIIADDNLHAINVDPGQLEHALINMGVNARDAMPDGGVLTLETCNIMLDNDQAERLDLEAGEYVKISVRDTGSGIPDHVVENIFNPFFTTKEEGKGTGLGLSMVYGFVKESGGAIDIDTAKGKGTCFDIYFPRSESMIDDVKNTVKQDNEEPGGDETILIVEDEDEIRLLTKTMLHKKGYTVLEAANSNEALNILQDKANVVHLLFTDIAMPGEMNGVQMAARAQVIKPDIKFLFTTGYAKGAIADIELTEKYPVINKPYQPEELIVKVRQALDYDS